MKKAICLMIIVTLLLPIMKIAVMPVAAQEPLNLQLKALPNPTRDVEGATITASVTFDGEPVEGALVEFSFTPGAPPHSGFDDDDDINTPPVAQISGTTNQIGEFQAHWGYWDICLVSEETITFEAVASKVGYVTDSDSCLLTVLPISEAPYTEPLFGETTIRFPSGPHNVYATLSPITGTITSGETVYFDIQIGREIDQESIDELGLDSIWMIPGFKNSVGYANEANAVTISLPNTSEVQAEVVEDEIMVEVYHPLLSSDWIPISNVQDLDDIISLVSWLRGVGAFVRGGALNDIGVLASQIPNVISTLATAIYGEELGHGPQGEAFDPANENIELFTSLFGVGGFGVDSFRIRLPVKFFGEGSIDVDLHVAFAFVNHNQYVLNYAGAQFDSLSFNVQPARLGLDMIFAIDTTGSMWDDIDNVKISAAEIVNEIDATISNYRIAVVDYRDFPVSPYGAVGDYPFHDVLPFSTDKTSIIAAIQSLSLGNGMDWQESVYSALMHSIDCTSLGGWRGETEAAKVIILMGDAPPHDPEPFTDYTLSDVATAAENADPVHIYPIQIGGTIENFEGIAEQTGGISFTAGNAGEVVDTILEALEIISSSPVAEAGFDQTVGLGDTVEFSGSGYDPDGTIVLYEWDFEGDGIFDYSSTSTGSTTHTYGTSGIFTAILRVTDNSGLQDTDFAIITVEATDELPPTSTLLIGEPKYIDPMNNIYVTSSTLFTLEAEDNTGGTGVASTSYRIYNSEYDSGILSYSTPFYLNGVPDALYAIDYFSTDIIGNTEETNTADVILDNTGPSISVSNPSPDWALQDGVTFSGSVVDSGSGVSSVIFAVREDGDSGNPVGFEDLPATYNPTTGDWSLSFDTLLLPDGYYVLYIESEDNLGNINSKAISYSIRNWAVLELLPASLNYRAGRTMPIKFSLRVCAAVDASQPFVYNEELRIDVFASGDPDDILQESFFGDTSRDYRISSVQYVTNFKTSKTPLEYAVTINRATFEVDRFTFETTRK